MRITNSGTMINNMSISKRKDGRYEGRITVNSKRKCFYGKTKVEVKNKAKIYLNKIENGYVEPKNIILNDYILYWLKEYKLNKIEPSSYSRLFITYENQIKKSKIGEKKIGEVTTKDIQKLIDDHANPVSEDVKPLALSGLKKIIQLLRPCFNIAIREGIIKENPALDVVLPTESCIQTKTKKQFSLSDKEMQQFKEAALATYKNGEYRSRDCFVLLIMINTGMRVGEMLALEWDDVNLDKNLMYINKTIQSGVRINPEDKDRRKNCDILKQSAKTNSGTRVIKINDSVKTYFNEIIEYNKRHGIKTNYVSCTNNGTRNTQRNLARSLETIIKRSDINKNVTLHTLRHTFGSTLIRKGIGVEVVSKLMGHANVAITYSKYIHCIKEQEAMAMNMVQVC